MSSERHSLGSLAYCVIRQTLARQSCLFVIRQTLARQSCLFCHLEDTR